MEAFTDPKFVKEFSYRTIIDRRGHASRPYGKGYYAV